MPEEKLPSWSSMMRFELISNHLFGEQLSVELANHLKAKKEDYIKNAAVHFWINKDAIHKLKMLTNDTSKIITLIDQELRQD